MVGGSDDEDPAVGKAVVKTTTPSARCMRHTTSKILASKTAAAISATQAAATKKMKRKGTTTSMDMTMSGTETGTVVGHDDDARSPDTPTEQAKETLLKVMEKEHPKPNTDETGNAG
jgi:hypothetical protein